MQEEIWNKNFVYEPIKIFAGYYAKVNFSLNKVSNVKGMNNELLILTSWTSCLHNPHIWSKRICIRIKRSCCSIVITEEFI